MKHAAGTHASNCARPGDHSPDSSIDASADISADTRRRRPGLALRRQRPGQPGGLADRRRQRRHRHGHSGFKLHVNGGAVYMSDELWANGGMAFNWMGQWRHVENNWQGCARRSTPVPRATTGSRPGSRRCATRCGRCCPCAVSGTGGAARPLSRRTHHQPPLPFTQMWYPRLGRRRLGSGLLMLDSARGPRSCHMTQRYPSNVWKSFCVSRMNAMASSYSYSGKTSCQSA
jgi:hypothetical protein